MYPTLRQVYAGKVRQALLVPAPLVPQNTFRDPGSKPEPSRKTAYILAMDVNEPNRPAKRKRLNFACNHCEFNYSGLLKP